LSGQTQKSLAAKRLRLFSAGYEPENSAVTEVAPEFSSSSLHLNILQSLLAF
jgi:hypothetical protein